MNYKDYYETLGVARDASDADIKQAYRKLARRYHPDVSKEPDAEARFKAVNEAYQVLRDAEKRAAYDALGSNWQSGQPFEPPPGWDSGFEFSERVRPGDEADFSSLFESLFGAQARRAAAPRDHHARIVIDVEDSYRGATRELTLSLPEYGADGRLQLRERRLKVRIPRGIAEGQHVRLRGQAASSAAGGEAGDLYLEVSFAERPGLRVDGRDVHQALPVAPWDAALGGRVVAETPAGRLSVKVPARARSGQQLRLAGKGLPSTPPGDLLLTIDIALPEIRTDAQREAFERLRDAFAATTEGAPT